jgi:hypothetical protein
MFAMITKVQIDPSQAQAAATEFTTKVLPRVTSAEGFAGGYWLEPANGEGAGFVLFETQEQARRAAPAVGSSASGATILSVDIRRVAVAIPGKQPSSM